MSIRTRVTRYGIGVVALVLGVISALFLLLVAGSVPQNQDKELAERAVAAVAAVESGAEPVARAPLGAVDLATSTDFVTIVLDTDAAVLASTGVVDGRPPVVPADVLTTARTTGEAAATVTAGPVSLRVHARPWNRGDGTGFVVTAQATSRIRTDRQGAVAVIVLSGLGSLVAAAVGIWLVAGRALRPLRQLSATVEEIARSGDLGRRLPPAAGRDDVARLTEGFNAMMARVQDAYRRLTDSLATQQRFTADASHELRTPLATVRGNAGFLRTHPDAAEADRADALADIESESARMSRLVDDLLTLARADSGQRPRMEPLDLGALAEQVCRQARTAHPDRTVHCAGLPVRVLGDEDSLRRLLWILLDNAFGHVAEGGTVWVAVTTRGPLAVLQVSDDGPGIAPHLRERVFERFFRADETRHDGGAGLGLSIARWIVWAHGGAITATDNTRGGATFTAELPVPPVPPVPPVALPNP
jgi:two-component system, OmpR family, sensor kinase